MDNKIYLKKIKETYQVDVFRILFKEFATNSALELVSVWVRSSEGGQTPAILTGYGASMTWALSYVIGNKGATLESRIDKDTGENQSRWYEEK